MKAKFVYEALEESKSNILEQLIIDNTKTKNTRAKLLDYLERIKSFSLEKQNIEKKELTKMVNELGDLVGSIITSGGYHSPRQEEYRKDLDVIAQEYGYRSSYEAGSSNKTNPEHKELFLHFNFLSVYGLSDMVRKQRFIESHKLSQSFEELVEKYFPNLKEWADLGDKLEEIRKILNPTAEERKKKELEQIKGKVNPEIKSAIDEIAEDFRKIIEKNEFDLFMRRVKLFQEKYPQGANDNARRERSFRETYSVISFLLKEEPKFSSILQVITNFEETAQKRAYNISVETIASWQGKMYDKLGGFISELGKKFTVDVSGSGALSNDIIFKFDDGSRFDIQNQIVGKVSHLGTYFYTYPTTFHNAYLPDGTKISGPSEFTVKKSFNDYQG